MHGSHLPHGAGKERETFPHLDICIGQNQSRWNVFVHLSTGHLNDLNLGRMNQKPSAIGKKGK
jgi:hypothetical protein